MTIENLEELRARLLNEHHVQQMVRIRAYEIYEMRGCQPGWEAQDWLQAEGEVLAFLIANESSREDHGIHAAGASEAHPTDSRPAKKVKSAAITTARKPTTKQSASKKAPSKKPGSKAKSPRRGSRKPDSER